MCDLVTSELMNMTLIMDSNIENRKRLSPELFPLVDIAFIDVVTPLVTVSFGNHQHREVAGRSH
jgi:hypothetical protein